ncbi:hypothetical protein [Zobellella sp. DQSA1]|uniref:hypothetical protein n=1 Tax=Zobellella sp. DQSA1 TaxID=3342386 RepID=UPI0035C128B8
MKNRNKESRPTGRDFFFYALKTSNSRRCNRITPGAAVTSSCSALVIPDSVSQSPPIITSLFSRTQSAPRSGRSWLASHSNEWGQVLFFAMRRRLGLCLVGVFLNEYVGWRPAQEQLIAAGVSSGANAAIQYGTTGEVKLSDVIGSGMIGAITAGKGYDQTVMWNAVGGYYSAEIKGDDPFMAALLSKAGASVGYATGNIIKVPMERVLNPVSKQYEWIPTGIWTITKPAPQSSIPSIFGNAGDSFTSELSSDSLNKALQNKERIR